MNEHDDNLNLDDIDFTKTKRGKSKGTPRRISLLLIEGLLLLVVMVAGAQFLFTDNAEVTDLQATIDTQNIVATEAAKNRQTVLSADQLYERAMTEIDNGDTDAALRSLDLAIELDPTLVDAYYERASLHYDLDHFQQAIDDYTQAIELNVDAIGFAYYWRGRSLYQLDEWENAIRDFNRTLTHEPKLEEAFYWRGRASMKLGEYEDGIYDVLEAVGMGYDGLQYAYFYVALSYDSLEEYLKAITYYTRSIEAIGDECERYDCWIDYNNRGTSYYWSGNYDKAIEDYTKAIQVNPDEYPLALKNRGDAYLENGEPTLALSDWNTMFQLIAGDIVNRNLHGDSQVLRGEVSADDMQLHVSIDGTAGQTINIVVDVPVSSSLNAMLILRDSNGVPLAYDAPGDRFSAEISDYVLPADDTYTIVVASNLATSQGEFVLRVE